MTVSIDDQIKCVARELALRRNVYKGFVARGRMTQITADKEIEAMTAVMETIKAVAEAVVTPEMIRAALRELPPLLSERDDAEGAVVKIYRAMVARVIA